MVDLPAKNLNSPISAEKLRIIAYVGSEGQPRTSFVALTDAQWQEVIETGDGNLNAYVPQILLDVEGHEPNQMQILNARALFDARYPAAVIGRNGGK